MLTEINKDFYCSVDKYVKGKCVFRFIPYNNCFNSCPCCRRKYPTPEQFEAEYGFKWEGACYYLGKGSTKNLPEWHDHIPEYEDDSPAICACTPCGRPPAEWRPE